MRYLASIKYDGSNFYGFERLNEERSVQKEIEDVLSKIAKKNIVIKGSGRTDRFVHAYDQHIHFDLDIDITIDKLLYIINNMLPNDIRFNSIKEVDKDFHARFNVKYKVYEYIINIGEYDLFKDKYLYNYNKKLDVKKMRKAASYLVGAHSYKAFVSGYRANYDSIINSIDIIEDNNLIVFRLKGKSFYRYMVRNIVGALLLIGENKYEPNIIEKVLNNEKNINYKTLPGCALYLKEVNY